MKIEFTEATHSYAIDGKPMPSVTQVIKEIVGIGWSAEEWYLQRGRAIHACAALIAQGKEFKFDDRLAGYVQALKRFFRDVRPTECMVEQVIGSSVFHFAGTADLLCKIGGRRCVVDWKHSMDKIRIPLQLGGYSVAAKETFGFCADVGYGVQIREDGTYQMTEKIDLAIPRNIFLSLRTAYRIKELCGELSTQKEQSK